MAGISVYRNEIIPKRVIQNYIGIPRGKKVQQELGTKIGFSINKCKKYFTIQSRFSRKYVVHHKNIGLEVSIVVSSCWTINDLKYFYDEKTTNAFNLPLHDNRNDYGSSHQGYRYCSRC